ncbi:lysophospholipid acyltransferase family protein [Shimia sp. MMG029]|uniref:lysophospholipid acyltransferase family protein n=1 Tax=Shimia sp. MMG029 TaxID=3021978 RepID=UPI0022FE5ECC|nr:lysophospholipid acyltransferase family protein [Shimia sp. MMG029]MDA5557596.1 lysophospholipid acyltransferase family protein [Shimia sp. MMG029]
MPQLTHNESTKVLRPRKHPWLALIALRSVLFYVGASLAALPFLLLWPGICLSRDTVYAVTDRYLRIQLWLLRVMCGVRYEVRGQENLPDTPVLMASQHESTWETLFFQLLLKRPVMYAKQPIFSYPIFGPLMRKLGHVPVATSATGDTMRDGFRAGAAAVKEGRNLLIFPSGTRRLSQDGQVQAGVGVLYQLAGVPAVPICLNSGACWPYGTLLKYPGTIIVEIGAPIEAGLDRRSFMAQLSAALHG